MYNVKLIKINNGHAIFPAEDKTLLAEVEPLLTKHLRHIKAFNHIIDLAFSRKVWFIKHIPTLVQSLKIQKTNTSEIHKVTEWKPWSQPKDLWITDNIHVEKQPHTTFLCRPIQPNWCKHTHFMCHSAIVLVYRLALVHQDILDASSKCVNCQECLDKEDHYKSVFTPHLGLWRFIHTPIVVNNAPGTIGLVKNVGSSILKQQFPIFQDEAVIISLERSIKHVRETLNLLEDTSL